MISVMLSLELVTLFAFVGFDRRVPVGPFLVTAITLLPIYVGYSWMGIEGGTLLISFGGLIAGYLGYYLSKNEVAASPLVVSRDSLAALLWFVVIAVAYHFYKVGIPILSPNIEVARFQFNGSGLFGVPGRLYLFGIPLTVGAVVKANRSSPRPQLLIAALSVITLADIAGGFKSSVLQILTVLFFALSTSSLLGLGAFVRRFSLPVVLAFVFAVLVFSMYATSTRSGNSAAEGLYRRIFVQSSEPGALLLSPGAHNALGESTFVMSDTRHYIAEYFHLGHGPTYSFNQLVSARLSNLRLGPDSYLVPVTTGGFPELAFELGTPVAVLGITALGWIFGWVESRARRSRSLARYVMSLSGVFALNDFITKGNIIYDLINWSAVGLGLVGFLWAWPRRSPGPGRERDTRPPGRRARARKQMAGTPDHRSGPVAGALRTRRGT